MSKKSFTQRRLEKRHKNPDFEITAHITGVRCGDDADMFHYSIEIEGEDDQILAAGILERAVEVLRDE